VAAYAIRAEGRGRNIMCQVSYHRSNVCVYIESSTWQKEKTASQRDNLDVERIYWRRPRPLCPPHLITLQCYSLLRFFVRKLAMTSGSLHLCPEMIYNPWLCQNLSNLVLNVLVVLADTAQFGKLFHVYIALLVRPNFRRSYFT